MFRLVQEPTQKLPDVDTFVATLNSLSRDGLLGERDFFDPQREVVLARAPGRLDVMGGIADYSGSLVLQLPLREAALAALQRDGRRTVRLVSLAPAGSGTSRTCELPLEDFEPGGRPIDYSAARVRFQRVERDRWSAYAAGTFLVLMRERGVSFAEGARVLISSSVPEGKGVSSSAALEVAVMQAVAAAFRVDLEPRELALLCQKVENLVVGAPCGVMDQMTAACGESDRLLRLLCQPAELQGHVPIPDGLAVWGLDSGIRHSVAGADYGSVRVGAFMGLRMVSELSGAAEGGGSRNRYLANISPSEFESSFARRLPETIRGREFQERFGETIDSVTRIDQDRSYAVRAPTAHPIHEHFRVKTFAELLEGPPSARRSELLGELMFQSHASYSACGLGSDGTDHLVDLVREAGAGSGLYGAKITGGGSGGTVAVLGRRGADERVEAIADRYAEATGYRPVVFAGSSPGAARFGTLRLRRS